MALSKTEKRKRRHARVRKKISGTAERPRLCVFRSKRHIYAQLIDDETGRSICGVSTVSARFRQEVGKGSTKQAARAVGAMIAAKAKEADIEKVVFDRGGYKYHGRVRELAEGAREGGLKF